MDGLFLHFRGACNRDYILCWGRNIAYLSIEIATFCMMRIACIGPTFCHDQGILRSEVLDLEQQ